MPTKHRHNPIVAVALTMTMMAAATVTAFQTITTVFPRTICACNNIAMRITSVIPGARFTDPDCNPGSVGNNVITSGEAGVCSRFPDDPSLQRELSQPVFASSATMSMYRLVSLLASAPPVASPSGITASLRLATLVRSSQCGRGR